MGRWLNTGLNRFRQVVENSEFYVDKTGMLAYLNRWLFSEDRFVCVSRARRFGKSIAAKMIAAYYDKTVDSRELFADFEIARHPSFEKGLNKFNVLYWDAQQFMEPKEPERFIPYTSECLLKELMGAFPGLLSSDLSLLDALATIHEKTGETFVVVIDEWDCIFRYRFPDKIQREYIDFFRKLFKSADSNDFIALAYMTGIFPIVKYNVESALNVFKEYTMIHPKQLAPYVGFTKDEVRKLCTRYQMDYDECCRWYDGYLVGNDEHIYNPNAIYQCMSTGEFGSYWTRTGTYEQISDHIMMNFDGLRDDVLALMTGAHVPVRTAHFQNKMTDLKNKHDVFTLLIHLGYLGYDAKNGECFIPNKEIHLEFEPAFEDCGMDGAVQAYQRSKRIMNALVARDANTVAAEIQKVHDDLSSILTYNNESDLALVVMYACAAGRKNYKFVRELPTGAGFADIVMIPIKPGQPGIVMELKWDQSAEGAIVQIKQRRYANFFEDYQGEVILCGVNYNSDCKDKKLYKQHTCVIENWVVE